MSSNHWPHPDMPDRDEHDPDRVAFLIPGHGYSAERPLLHFAAAVFAKHGWTTQNVWWSERPPARDGDDLVTWFRRLREFTLRQITPILDAEPAPKIALVGKSLGTFAASPAADRGLPGIWLTPVLRDSGLPADLHRATAPFLLVGSAADRSWDGSVARGMNGPLYETEDADHGLEIAGDPVRSAEILREVTSAMDDFVARL
jgi:hypothetical protein